MDELGACGPQKGKLTQKGSRGKVEAEGRWKQGCVIWGEYKDTVQVLRDYVRKTTRNAKRK